MKKLPLLILNITAAFVIYAQNQNTNTYRTEQKAYFINPQSVNGGIIATDNYNNALYFISHTKNEKVFSAPGCGRYFVVSPDKNVIGFKYIENGLQRPALYNVLTKKVSFLHQAVMQCGQPSFSNNGKIAYTVGNNLHVFDGGKSEVFNLGTYSNICPISPDGNRVIFSNSKDELVLLDLLTKSQKTISEQGKMSVYPQWSPDGKKVLFQSGNIFIYDIEQEISFDFGEGLGPKWSPDAENIVFYKTDVQDFKLHNADIFMADYKGINVRQITNTENLSEMQPSFVDEHTIVYHTYDSKKIIIHNVLAEKVKLRKLIYLFNTDLEPDFFNLPQAKAEIRIPGNIPYVHQVYDTPNGHYGHGSCAPATSVMAFAYFNRLPKWPISCSAPYTHTSDYGSYVSQKYTLNTYFYENVAQTSGGDNAYGGYGYMWGLGSPNSKMKDYTAAHYFNSVQFWTSSCTMLKTRTEIDAGYPHSMCVMLTSSGHLILCKGYVVNQGTFIFSDPYGNKNTPGYPSYDGHETYYDWPGHNNGYQNLDYNGSYGYIAWTVTNQGAEVTYNDTIIDDVYYNHGFHMNNSLNASHMRYFHDANAGYNNHMWYTYTMANASDICWVTWQPNLNQNGLYEVLAYIPAVNANAVGARYKITHANGDTVVIINQSNYNDEWVSLGLFEFDTASVALVYLGDSTGVNSQKIAFDAVQWLFKPKPIAAFTSFNNNICPGDTVYFNNTSIYGLSFQWLCPGGAPSASNDVNPQIMYDTPGTYSVTLITYGNGGIDTVEVQSYIKVKNFPQANFEAIDTLIYMPPALAAFVNLSTDADTYFWDFGNGSTSADVNPYCIYSDQGIYTVTLHAFSNCGLDSIERTNFIYVLNSGLSEDGEDLFKIYPNPFTNNITIQFPNLKQAVLCNMLGQEIQTVQGSNSQIVINTSTLTSGVYSLTISNIKGDRFCYKILKK